MQHIPRITFKMLAAGLIFLSAIAAHAQFQVTVAPGLVDNQGNPASVTFTPIHGETDAIDITSTQIVAKGGVKFVVSGHVTQMLTGQKAVSGLDLRFTRLTIINVGMPVTSSITVQSDVFKPIGPPFFGRVHLDGKYTSRGFINDATVSMSGSVSPGAVAIGTVSIPNVKNQQPPVAFGPLAPPANLTNAPFSVGPTPDATKTVQVGVTQESNQLNFTLKGVGDTIVLSGSAFIAGYAADRVFTVNSTADLADGFPGDGVCDTGSATMGFTGICTLRAALTEADFQPVVTAIQFNIPGSGIPAIKMQSDTTFNFGSMGALQQVIVDGTTQPAGLVEIDGSDAAPNDVAGNPIVGLDLVGANSTVLGLLIHSFPSHAIQIRPTGAPFGGSNVIEENAIGIDTTGLPRPNSGDGVHIFQQPGNSILDNVIANNAGQGVSIDGSAATGNTVHANSIDANGGLGISLTNSSNNSQSPPVLSSATEDGFNLTVAGTLLSTPNLTFNLDFFANSNCDPSGSGEGADFLGSTQATTDSSGNATFTATLPANIAEGTIATATATDSLGNTSQFSTCATIAQVPPTAQPPVANAGSNQTVSAGTPVTLNGSGSSDPNIPPLPLTFLWTQTAGPAVTLTGATTATPSFTPTQAGTYLFSLVVNNGVANSAASSVTITVTAAGLAVQVTSSGFLFSRVTRTFNGTVTVTNTGGSAISGPLQVQFADLPATVTLVNATGVVGGVPFITLPGGLAQGQSTSFTVQFNNPSNVNIHYSPIVNGGAL